MEALTHGLPCSTFPGASTRLFHLPVFPSHDYPSLNAIAAKFIAAANVHPEAACFGIAGPVVNGRVDATNLPWSVVRQSLADELQIAKTTLINDLEANAWGIPALGAKDLVALNQVGSASGNHPVGNQAVVSAGTGLGEAGMYWDGKSDQVFACEGGHCDFAPRNELEVELFTYLQKQFGHVSYERVLSEPRTGEHFQLSAGQRPRNGTGMASG